MKRLTSRNNNPYDGEAHYSLGLALQYQGRLDEAYQAYYKAVWTYAWQSAGYYGLAQIDVHARRLGLRRSITWNARWPSISHSGKARTLKAALLRHSGQTEAAEALAAESLAPRRARSRRSFELAMAADARSEKKLAGERLDELKRLTRGDAQTYLDLAFDYASAGLYEEAAHLLEPGGDPTTLYPMVGYTLGWLAHKLGKPRPGAAWAEKAAQAGPDYCFPWRLEEMIVLQDAVKHQSAGCARGLLSRQPALR